MTQGLVELAAKAGESLQVGVMKSGAQARDEPGQADLFGGNARLDQQ